jgi:AcrR family transcriptional regulator
MTAADGTTQVDEQRPSLRERKKSATRRALRRVALDLVAERGFAHVTVEDIAEAADVSPRTFFNYFPSKEAAIVGADPEHIDALRQRLIDQPADRTPVEAVRAVLVELARGLSEELVELGGDHATWICRLRAAQVDPHLRAAQAAHQTMLEQAVISGVAERLKTDPEHDPYPVLLAGTAMGVMRAVVSLWARMGDTMELDAIADSAFQALASGLPQGWQLPSNIRDNEMDFR